MDESQLRTIAQLQDFLKATPQVSFSGLDTKDGDERYAQISRVLKRFDYPRRTKTERGVLLAYLQRISGYSRSQINRLVARWHDNRLAEVPLTKHYRAPVAPFARKYTASDIELLVQMDRANEDRNRKQHRGVGIGASPRWDDLGRQWFIAGRRVERAGAHRRGRQGGLFLRLMVPLCLPGVLLQRAWARRVPRGASLAGRGVREARVRCR